MTMLYFSKKSRPLLIFVTSLFLLSSLSGVASATPLSSGVSKARHEDVARWSKPDLSAAQRQATAVKEARNAYHENKQQCELKSTDKSQQCLTEANRIYQQELAFAYAGKTRPYPPSKLEEHVEPIDAESMSDD